MALFQPYSKAVREEVPGILQAEIADSKAKAAAKAAENSARSMNMLGGATIYNQGMKAAGKSPISDFIGDYFNQGFDPSAVQGVDNMPDMATEMGGGPEVVESTGSVTPYGTETGMVADPSMAVDPLSGAVEANAAVVDPLTGVNSSGIGGTIPEGVSSVTPDMGISGTAPVGDPLTSIGGEALGTEAAALGTEAGALGTEAAALGTEAGALGVEAGGTAALESALASNAAAGTGAAAGTTGAAGAAGAGAAGGGAMSSVLAALGPMGAIAALAALLG